MTLPVRALWKIEDGIYDIALGVIRHLLAVGGALGLGGWGQLMRVLWLKPFSAWASHLMMPSYVCSLSNQRDLDHAVTKGMLAFLIGGSVVLLTKGVFLTFLIYAVISAGFFIREIARWLSSVKPANNGHPLHDSGVGRFSDEELYYVMNAPAPSLTGYAKYDDDWVH
ncbi:hypothetical protein [Pseudomonas sp. SWI44]|uniref:hypothetical protein n=1 Tax=Pseudomonas sp. SWI44 TaxID=2083053 RepID=UPI0015A90C78|nr:hypothetical protein [Pseudomonas sp. SWI44]